MDALVADNGMRQRDERFATQGRHQQDPDPLHRRSQTLAEFAGKEGVVLAWFPKAFTPG